MSVFSGGISNAGRIAGQTGIMVGGQAATSASVTIGTFAGGISNAGTITGSAVGIRIGGSASSGGSVLIETFSEGVSNSGLVKGDHALLISDVANSPVAW